MPDHSVCVFCGFAWYLKDVDEWIVTIQTPPNCDHETIEGEGRDD